MSLDVFFKKSGLSLSTETKINFLCEAIEGLKFLHQSNIVHLDIKPGNIIISKRYRVQLADFGEAFILGEDDSESH
jgi:serine/threonine protein kinase